MLIQVFSEYLQLAQAGKVNFLACPMHKEHTDAVFALMHKEVEDKIMLHCVACNYRLFAGQQLYENILKKIESVKNDI